MVEVDAIMGVVVFCKGLWSVMKRNYNCVKVVKGWSLGCYSGSLPTYSGFEGYAYGCS